MINFIKKYKIALIACAIAVVALAVAFIFGGNSANKSSETPDSTQSIETTATELTTSAGTTASTTTTTTVQPTTEISTSSTQPITEKPAQNTVKQNSKTETKEQQKPAETQPATDKYKTEPTPQGKPEPVEPQEQTVSDDKIYCTFSISCSKILENPEVIDDSIADVVPKDGWILKPQRIEVNEGESVFDILLRVCRDNNIHTEYSWMPVYNSAYIEGIGNIYEFDCGELSGWMYKVNDWYPNYGCSRYVVSNNDIIEWNYTLNSGRDLGREYD